MLRNIDLRVRARLQLLVCVGPILAPQIGCASSGATPTPQQISAHLAERTGVDPRGWPEREAGNLPPDVVVDDGLTIQEAVATALWNNPGFQVALADLGVARAEVIEAGLLRNPIFSVLLPWGPKQLEGTPNRSIDAIW